MKDSWNKMTQDLLTLLRRLQRQALGPNFAKSVKKIKKKQQCKCLRLLKTREQGFK